MKRDDLTAFLKKIERRLTTGSREELRDREYRARDLHALIDVSPGWDSEHKRQLLEDAQLFTASELDVIENLSDEDLRHFLIRLQTILTVEQKRA